ncbi:MAG: DUF4440 domain-containing protein [Bacteroidetes bacterium]|nr:DUF4440 domain-containing protein [Bacteroidota bacterium]
MKTAILFGIILIAFACSSNHETSRKMAIQKMVMDSKDAWNKGDIPGFMGSYEHTNNTKFITKKGTTYGWDSTLARYLRSYPNREKMGRLEFTLDSTELLGSEYGHITGRWKLLRASDTPQGYFSLITRETKEGPKICIDHTW